MIFKGCGVNLVTPFTDTNEIDFELLASLLDRQIGKGANAIILGRDTGEFFTMNDDEIISLVKYVVDRVDSRIPVVVHTGFNDTARSVMLSIRAKMAGASALILFAPYCNIGNTHGMISHFKTVSISSGLPCYIENNPDIVGYDISVDTLASLYGSGIIAGVIESSHNPHRIAEIKNLIHGIDIICGSDQMCISAYSMGVESNISNMANIWSKEFIEISQLLLDGDFTSARCKYYDLYNIVRLMYVESNPIPIKTTMNIMGIGGGEFRLPLTPMNPDKAAQVVTLLMDLGIL